MPLLAAPVVPSGRWGDRPQPTLTADGLVLRPWLPGDAAAVRAAYEDPSIRWWHARTMADDDEALAWIDTKRAVWHDERGAEWAVTVPDVNGPGTVVGRVAFNHLNLYEGYGAMAYWVVPAARGRRVAVRAGTAALRWAFDDVGLHRVEVEHSTRNDASCRVAELLGCRAEGVRRAHALHADGHHDMHLHARLRTDRP